MAASRIYHEYQDHVKDKLHIQLYHPFEIRSLDEDARGVYTRSPIAADRPLLAVPFESLLTIQSISQSPALAPLRAQQPPLREDDLLAIALLHEKSIGSRSKWHQHIELLPKHVTNALNLSSEGITALKGSQLYPIAIQLQKQVQSDFEELSASPITIHHTSDDESTGQPLSSHDWWALETYRWALTQIFSRFVTIARKGQYYKAMVPFLDFLNHSPRSPLVHAFSDQHDSLMVVSLGDWPAGEVFLNYGCLSNLRLLMLHGFVLEGNEYDVVDVYVDVTLEAPHYEEKRKALHQLGFHPPYQVLAKEPFISPSLMAAIRIQRASGKEELGRLDQAMLGQISERNERETLSALETALEGMMGGLEEDRNEEEEHLRLVHLYIKEEKNVYRKGLQRIQEMKGKLR